MSFEDIKTLLQSSGGILLVVMTLVQITPIKVNPWTWICKKAGEIMLHDVTSQIQGLNEHMEKLDKKVSSLDEERLKDNADRTRAKILNFSDDIRRETRHSEESFNQILDDITTYERYCEEHPNYKNRRASAAIALIIDTHRKCVENNSFL